METPKVSQMWDALQKANRLPQTDTLNGAESELQELMRQIDIMVQSKKADWEREKHTLQGKLEVREQEFKIQRSTLEQKHKEIGELRSHIETAEQSQRSSTQEYEKQLIGLRNEVASMKKEHEKLHRRYSKQAKEAQKDKQRLLSSAEESSSEVKRLNERLEDSRKRSKEWEVKRRDYEQQLETLETLNRGLEDKCLLIQRQTNSYQSQLTKRQDLLDSTEVNLSQQVAQLESQVSRAKETTATQDSQILRLKSSLEDAFLCQRKIVDEREALETENRKCQSAIQGQEAEIQELRQELQTYKVQRSRHGSQPQQTQDVVRLHEVIREKETIIDNLKSNSPGEHQRVIAMLQSELQTTKSDLMNCQHCETQARDELKCLQQKLDESRRENVKLNTKLTSELTDMTNVERNSLMKFKNELNKIMADCKTKEETYKCEVDSLTNELAAVRTELQERNITMATLTEKMATLERQSREHDEILDKTKAEIQVSTAQLDALRLENRHLRHSAMSLGGASEIEINEAESHLKKLQLAYTNSIASLENENAKLQDDLVMFKSQLNLVEESKQQEIQLSMRQSQHTIQELKQQEDRRLSEVQEANRHRVQFLEDKMADTVQRYESQMRSMRLEMSQTGDSQNNSITGLDNLEHQVLSHFAEGLDRIANSPRQSDHHSDSKQSDRHSNSNQSDHHSNGTQSDHRSGSNRSSHRPSIQIYEEMEDDIEDDYLTDTAEAATAKFMRDQEERTRDLEEQLDAHIQYLKTKTSDTVNKYVTAH